MSSTSSFPGLYILNHSFNFYCNYSGWHQKWFDWAWIRSSISWSAKTERRVHYQKDVWNSIRSFQVVGLSCYCGHSHILPPSLLRHSQVQGESFTIVSDTVCQKSSTSSWKETFLQENAIFPFQTPQPSLLTIFSRGPELSNPLNRIISKLMI